MLVFLVQPLELIVYAMLSVGITTFLVLRDAMMVILSTGMGVAVNALLKLPGVVRVHLPKDRPVR